MTLLDEVQSSRRPSFGTIPMIDLAEAGSEDIHVRKRIAVQIRDACVNVGFFYVTNHSVPQSDIDAVVNEAHRFFDEPLERKMQVLINKSPNFKGYTPLLGENTDPDNRGDLHEGFDLGWEDRDPYSGLRGGPMEGQNVWPEDLPGFQEAVMKYYYSLIDLGDILFRLFALALELPEDFFDDKTQRPAAILRLLYYPPQTGLVDDSIIGIGAHTDYECFTILWQDEQPALQVLNNEGHWIDAKPIPGSFVINIGDQLARWTNDIFKSTRHRAINRTGVRRYSMPLFFGSDYAVKLEAIPTCVSADRPAKYEVVTAGDYVKSRLEATYAPTK